MSKHPDTITAAAWERLTPKEREFLTMHEEMHEEMHRILRNIEIDRVMNELINTHKVN
jgi:hypothetical protein